VLCAACALSVQCLAQAPIPATAEGLFALAEKLYSEGNYDDAITEYKRLLFHFPTCKHTLKARLKIAYSYRGLEQWPEAARAFRELADEFCGDPLGREARFEEAESYFLAEQYDEALTRYERFLSDCQSGARTDKARLRIGWCRFLCGRFAEARAEFGKLDSASQHAGSASVLASACEEGQIIRYKSRALATGLAVIPGAGHVYAGRKKDGIVAFLIVGVLAGLTYEAFDHGLAVPGTIAGLFTLSQYCGSIIGARHWTDDHNQRIRTDFIQNVRTKHGLSLGLSPIEGGGAVAVGFQF